MKVFKTVQWSLALMGYYSSQQHKFSPLQLRRALEALLIIIINFVYLFHVANTNQERIYSIFMIVTIIGIFISFVSTANKTATIFVLIEKTEKIVNEGKYTVRHTHHMIIMTQFNIYKILLFDTATLIFLGL